MSRRQALGLLLALSAALPLAACGRKGDLEPPPSKEESEKPKPAGS